MDIQPRRGEPVSGPPDFSFPGYNGHRIKRSDSSIFIAKELRLHTSRKCLLERMLYLGRYIYLTDILSLYDILPMFGPRKKLRSSFDRKLLFRCWQTGRNIDTRFFCFSSRLFFSVAIAFAVSVVKMLEKRRWKGYSEKG